MNIIFRIKRYKFTRIKLFLLDNSDQKLVSGLQTGDLGAYEDLHKKYYVYLCFIARHISKSHADAEEIVSDVFVKLWNSRERLEITSSVKAYLIRAVQNTSLNYIEQNALRLKSTANLDTSDLKALAWDSDYPLGHLFEKELQNILSKCINELPESCREIFLLSRDNDMKYSDISKRLNISVNTVKTQLKIALSRLREAVRNYNS